MYDIYSISIFKPSYTEKVLTSQIKEKQKRFEYSHIEILYIGIYM